MSSHDSRADSRARERQYMRGYRLRERLRREGQLHNAPVDLQAPLPVVRTGQTHIPVAASHVNRHRLRRQREEYVNDITTVQDAVNQLNEATSNLSSVLNEPLPSLVEPEEHTHESYASIDSAQGKRSKRRKLDSDRLHFAEIPKYEYKGRAVPGRLKMHIASCDGGAMEGADSIAPYGQYLPQNVLQNDKSVYCTSKRKCNIILRHGGETPFALTKIVVKTPDYGFTAPVQEGMIFISMKSDDLLFRTARYEIKDSSPPTLHHCTVPSEQGHLAQGNDDVTEQTSEARPPSRRAPYPSAHAIRTGTPPTQPTRLPPIRLRGDEEESDSTLAPADLGNLSSMSRPLPAPLLSPTQFHVTMTCSDPSDDEEETTSPVVLLDRQRRRAFPSYSDITTSDSDTDSLRRRLRRLQSAPRRIEWVGKKDRLEEDGSLQAEPVVLQPHARFFIERGSSLAAVRFEPPVSGRYILIKMWSPPERRNIDVQSISAYGFAGPRLFPATKLL